MSDGVKIVRRGIGITYQLQLDSTQTLAFEVAADVEISRSELDDILDRVGGAAERRQAMLELPICKMNLLTNLKMLANQREARAKAVAVSAARIERLTGSRRKPVPMALGDENAISEFDKRIMQIEGSIKTGEMRIPYLEAIIARQPPPELFPELDEAAEAAE